MSSGSHRARNANRADFCPNSTVIDEDELLSSIRDYFSQLLRDNPNVIDRIVAEFNRVYKAKDKNQLFEKDIASQLSRLQKTKEKYMDMYTADVITIGEPREKK